MNQLPVVVGTSFFVILPNHLCFKWSEDFKWNKWRKHRKEKIFILQKLKLPKLLLKKYFDKFIYIIRKKYDNDLHKGYGHWNNSELIFGNRNFSGYASNKWYIASCIHNGYGRNIYLVYCLQRLYEWISTNFISLYVMHRHNM